VVSFRDSGLAFPIRGHIVSRKVRMDVDGMFADVFDPGAIDAALRVTGPTLSQLHPFVRIRPPASRPFEITARLKHHDHIYRFTDLSGKIGDTDLSGAVTYDRSGERARVEADLSSRQADVADLRALIGLPPAATRGGDDAAADTGLLPSRRIGADRLRALDVRLSMNARKLKAANAPMLDSLALEARLTAGALELSKLDLGIAGGHVTGTLSLNAQREPPSSSAAVELRGLRLERLLPTLAEKTRGAGVIGGHVKLSGHGDSLAAMVGTSNGSIRATMARGRISSLSDAKLGLDFGKIFFELIRGERDSAIHCGEFSFNVRDGVGKSQAIVLDTESTHVRGAGTLDLRKEQLDVRLTPEPKNPGLFTRRASIRVHGPWRAVKTAVEPRFEAASAAAPAACAG
jgi:uncharacterized protein involved in outer membrane biogenesis